MFIQPCFIRKNTPELRKKLEELGYKDSIFDDLKLGGIITFPSRNEYSVWANYHFNVYILNSYIDCGTNEELFLALVALRDDSDYMQWFICQEEYISINTMDLIKVGTWQLNTQHIKLTYSLKKLWRKATVKEIVKHFKSK